MTVGSSGRCGRHPSDSTDVDADDPSSRSRRQFLRLGGALVVGATAGCLQSAPTASQRQLDAPTAESRALPTQPDVIFQSDVERTGYWPDQSIPAEVRLDWSMPGINTGTHTAAKSSPLYYDGDVVVSGDTGTVRSVDPDGEENWSASLVSSGRGTHSTPAIVDDYVFTSGYDGAAYAFDADTGDQIWRTNVSDAIGSSPVYYDGMVYVATEFYDPSGGMVALDAATGVPIWEDNRMTNHAHSITGIDTDARRFAAGCNDGSLYVWNLDDVRNGEEDAFEGTFETGDPIKGPICMYDGLAFFGSWDGYVYAVDIETLTEEWAYDTPYKIMSGAAVHPDSDTVLIGTHGDDLLALDAQSGELQWRFETGGWIVGGVTVAGDTALAGSYDSTLYAVDVESGDEQWSFEGPHGRVSSAPAVHDGDVYVTERASFTSDDRREESGHLYKLTGA